MENQINSHWPKPEIPAPPVSAATHGSDNMDDVRMDTVSRMGAELKRLWAGTTCQERGKGKGKAHVFINNSKQCQCGQRRLK